MKAIVDRFGLKSKLREQEFQTPQITARTILVKVKCYSLNPIDYKIKKGFLRPFTWFRKIKLWHPIFVVTLLL